MYISYSVYKIVLENKGYFPNKRIPWLQNVQALNMYTCYIKSNVKHANIYR